MTKKNSRAALIALRRLKAVRKPARPTAPKSIDFPIDKLPPELVHMICLYLKPTELANLRLVSRIAAPIGLHYMVPEAHLLLAKDSFKQLKALSEHPIASRYVTSFFFEADKLGVLPRKHWEQLVAGPQYVAQVEQLRMRGHPCPHASERSLRTFKRECSKLSTAPRHHYAEEQMDHAFGIYRDFVHFQQHSQEIAVQEKEVIEAMRHFPKLRALTMATQFCTRSWTSKLRKTFEPAFCTYHETDGRLEIESDPLGLRQMRSLLLGAHSAGLKVEFLHCGVVSWRILTQDDETFARMRASVSNVQNLRLEFATGHEEYDNPSGELEIQSCSIYLETGRLRDFITAAPKLQYLQIGFQFNEPTWPALLKHVVGQHHWPALRSVKLKMIGTSEEDLVSFCARHAATLKVLHLTSIGLVEGDWFSALSRMRKILTLDAMVVAGRLEGLGEELDFEMGSEEYCPELKEGIEAYFLGPCCEEELSLDDFLDFYLPNSDDTWSEYDSDDEGWF